MMTTTPGQWRDWRLIAELADRMGINPETLKKWRQRGVPHDKRLDLVRLSEGKISIDAQWGPVAKPRKPAA